jgi:hypothetical protein
LLCRASRLSLRGYPRRLWRVHAAAADTVEKQAEVVTQRGSRPYGALETDPLGARRGPLAGQIIPEALQWDPQIQLAEVCSELLPQRLVRIDDIEVPGWNACTRVALLDDERFIQRELHQDEVMQSLSLDHDVLRILHGIQRARMNLQDLVADSQGYMGLSRHQRMGAIHTREPVVYFFETLGLDDIVRLSQ